MTHLARNLSALGADGWKPAAELLPKLYKGWGQLAACRVAQDKLGQSLQALPTQKRTQANFRLVSLNGMKEIEGLHPAVAWVSCWRG